MYIYMYIYIYITRLRTRIVEVTPTNRPSIDIQGCQLTPGGDFRKEKYPVSLERLNPTNLVENGEGKTIHF